MKAKALIFDFDGTIADTWDVGNAAFKNTYERFMGKVLTDGELMTHGGYVEEVIVHRLVPHAHAEAEEFFFQEFTRQHDLHAALFDGIMPLLESLTSSNKRLAVVTAKGVHAAQISLERFPIGHLFERFSTATLETASKTPRISNQVQRWSLEASQAAYIGDTVSDMTQAREAGVVPLGAAWGGVATPDELRDAGADAVFTEPSQLLDWLHS